MTRDEARELKPGQRIEWRSRVKRGATARGQVVNVARRWGNVKVETLAQRRGGPWLPTTFCLEPEEILRVVE